MPNFISAGVYPIEQDDSLYTPALSPSIIGIVGTATKGPLNEAVVVTSQAALINTFGRPRTKDLGMHTAIEALKDARLVYFVRVAGAAAAAGLANALDEGSAATSAVVGPSANGEPFNLEPGQTVVIDVNGGGDDTATFLATAASRASGNTETYNLAAINGGGAVTLTVAIDGGSAQTITFQSTDFVAYAAATAEEVAQVINAQIVGAFASVTGGDTVHITSDVRGTDSIVNVTGGTANDAVNGLNFTTGAIAGTGNVGNIDAVTGSEVKSVLEGDIAGILVTVGVGGEITVSTVATGVAATLNVKSTSTAIGASPKINLTPLDLLVTGTAAAAAANTIRFTAATVGSHSSDIKVIVVDSAVLPGTKKVTIKYRDVTVETYDKLFKSPTPVVGGYDMIDTINDGSTDGAFPASEFITASDLNASGENPADATYTLSTGNDGDNWNAATVIGTDTGSVQTGMQVFKNPEKIDISILATPGISYGAVISAGIDLCTNRADCLYIVDAPQGLSAQETVDWHNGDNSLTVTVDQEGRTETNSTVFNSSYAALYAPWVNIFDAFNEETILVPPSSLVLRTLAYTDQVADPWFAPAGIVRTRNASIRDLEYSPDQGQRDLMQVAGNNVNPISNLAGIGITIMGQKTLQRTPTALDRVNVRRMLILVERIVARASQRIMFEQNDPVMWRRFINLVQPLLDDIRNRRGLTSATIVADSSTTTSQLLENNTFLAKIYIIPTKAAEIITISFNILPQGINVEEFVGQA